MGDVGRFLFGGSEQSSQQMSRSDPVDLTPGSYQTLRDPLARAFGEVISRFSSTSPTYTGPLTGDIGANETNLLSQLMGQTGGPSGRSGYLGDVIGGNYLPGSPGGNPFLDAAIKAAQRPTLQGLEETLSRALPGRFTQAGQFVQPQGSSAFDRAAGIATRGAADAVGDIATNISSAAYEGERGRQQQAVQLSQQEVDTTIKNLQAQALPRLIQENGIDRGIELFKQQTTQLLDLLRTIGALSAPTVAQQSQSVGRSEGTSERGAVPALFPEGL